MVHLQEMLSVRNVVRASGVLSLAVGCAHIILPGVIITDVYRARAKAEKNKRRMEALMRFMGVRELVDGLMYLLLKPTQLLARLAAADSAALSVFFMWVGSNIGRVGMDEDVVRTVLLGLSVRTVLTLYGAEKGHASLVPHE